MFETGEITSGSSFLSAPLGSSLSQDQSELKFPTKSNDIIVDLKKNIITILDNNPKVTSSMRTSTSTGTIARSAGLKRILVIRVNTNGGQYTPLSSEATLSDKFFGTSGDAVNTKSQFKKCSFGKLQIDPFIGKTSSGVTITNGVYTITIDADRDDRQLESKARSVGSDQLGDLQSQFDFVAFVVPPNNQNYAAFAYFNGWLTLYQGRYADLVTVQMHEIGHNLGLEHSGELEAKYGDISGVMGAVYKDDMNMCFNGAKSSQLGWYSDREVDVIGGYSGSLYGIADYGSTNVDTKMILKVSSGETEYYITFNKAAGITSDTLEGGNCVMVHSRNISIPNYAASNLLGKLNAGQSFKIASMLLKVNSIGDFAQVSISSDSTPSPTPAPTRDGLDCYEASYEKYFKFFRANGSVKKPSCYKLARSPDKDIQCSQTQSGGGYLAAKDVCKVTCNRCPANCGEITSTRFYWKTDVDGTIRTKNCYFLQKKKTNNRWQDSRFSEVCNNPAPTGYSTGSDACPLSCGKCPP